MGEELFMARGSGEDDSRLFNGREKNKVWYSWEWRSQDCSIDVLK